MWWPAGATIVACPFCKTHNQLAGGQRKQEAVQVIQKQWRR